MKKNNKGFTLAELLIVVAIIAVLVAIAIPIFNSQLEKARESTDVANARDYYAEISVGMLDGSLLPGGTMKVAGGLTATRAADPDLSSATTGTFTVSVAATTVNQKIFSTWNMGTDFEIGGVKGSDITAPTAASDNTITFTFTVDKNATTGATNTYITDVDWVAPSP